MGKGSVLKRGAIVVVLALGCSVLASKAGAAEIDAETFAIDNAYCGDGSVSFTGPLTVNGGTGVFPTNCEINPSGASAALKIVNATLSGPGYLLMAGGGPKNSIKVINSTITLENYVQLIAGCCNAESDKGKAFVNGSTIESNTSTVFVGASTEADSGYTKIINSTLDGGGGSGDYVLVQSSTLGGATKGKVSVTNSTLDATGQGIYVATSLGKTKVKGTTIYGGGTITAGGGKCKSTNNTPEIPCV
jgi:hypothetical protein